MSLADIGTLNEVINKAFLDIPEKANPLLQNYLQSCSRAEKGQLLRNVYQMHHDGPFLKFLLDYPLDRDCLKEWRSEHNDTVLHLGSFEYPKQLLKPEALKSYQKRLLDEGVLSPLLAVRNNKGQTPLESCLFISECVDKYHSAEGSVFSLILEQSLQSGHFPNQRACQQLLNQLAPDNGFPLMVLCRLTKAECGPSHLSLEGTSPLAAWCLNLLEKHQPLQSSEKQRAFLSTLQNAGFSDIAKKTIAAAFPPSVRAAIVPPRLSRENRAVWESEVMPLTKKHNPFGGDVIQLPWTEHLKWAALSYEPGNSPVVLAQWQKALEQIPAIEQLSQFSLAIPAGSRGVYGRSCYFQDVDTGQYLRLKFRKKGASQPEPWQEFASEPYKLQCLRDLQQSHQLPLQTHFPEPAGLYRIPGFKSWLTRTDLSRGDQIKLLESTHLEEDGSVLGYAYTTEAAEQYHHYPYETTGEGLSKTLSLESLHIAANDLGLLAGAGLAATVLPMYHAIDRLFVMLTQLDSEPCPGVLGYWNGKATSYPNISPGVGLRDYADVTPFKDMPAVLQTELPDAPQYRRASSMEQVAREFMSLILLYARTISNELNHNDSDAVQQITEEMVVGQTCYIA